MAKTVFVKLRDAHGVLSRRAVDAIVIPHTRESLVVHPTWLCDDGGTLDDDWWSITHFASGKAIKSRLPSKAAAIKVARAFWSELSESSRLMFVTGSGKHFEVPADRMDDCKQALDRALRLAGLIV